MGIVSPKSSALVEGCVCWSLTQVGGPVDGLTLLLVTGTEVGPVVQEQIHHLNTAEQSSAAHWLPLHTGAGRVADWTSSASLAWFSHMLTCYAYQWESKCLCRSTQVKPASVVLGIKSQHPESKGAESLSEVYHLRI